MWRRWFASGAIALLGLALGVDTFAEDAPQAKTEATIKAKNETIRRKLEKPIPLRVKDLPLGAVFDYFTKATTEPGDTGVPIDVDAAALARAQVTLATPVRCESKEGQSLLESLNVALGRMTLTARVEGGSLRISWRMYTLLDREPQTKLIQDRLEMKVDLSFEKTPLEDVLKFVKSATRKGPDDNGIPIYVDPVGLLEAERTLATPVSFTTKGKPLKSSLERLLKSIGLTYVVKDGLLTVTARTSDDRVPAKDTPRQEGIRPPGPSTCWVS
jgi:hypothetical protein